MAIFSSQTMNAVSKKMESHEFEYCRNLFLDTQTHSLTLPAFNVDMGFQLDGFHPYYTTIPVEKYMYECIYGVCDHYFPANTKLRRKERAKVDGCALSRTS